ncbi:Sir2 family transcriptional regulator [Entamoeba marina]
MSTCPHIPSTHKPFKKFNPKCSCGELANRICIKCHASLCSDCVNDHAHEITCTSNDTYCSKFKYITTKPRKIIVLAGAGISTSAGIPDFRTPGTGLYDNLQEYNLPFPEANPQPFFTLAKELFPGTGKYFPTPTHHFISFLEKKNLLMKIFTQNIDGLEKIVGVSDDKIIYAHGNYFSAHCLKCNKKFDQNQFVDDISNGNIVKCNDCGGLVKPDVVFFGENLPAEFFEGIDLIKTCDLLIVMGTSLTVHPFASLVNYTKSGCPRILINMDDVGSFEKPNDLKLLGKCDDTIMDLVDAFGWRDEFVSFMDSFK